MESGESRYADKIKITSLLNALQVPAFARACSSACTGPPLPGSVGRTTNLLPSLWGRTTNTVEHQWGRGGRGACTKT